MNNPCLNCCRVADPLECENMDCLAWRRWFAHSWEQLRYGVRLRREAAPEMEGVGIGGRRYALPHRVLGYLEQDPCVGCLCPRALCRIPCRVRRDWTRNRERLRVGR